MKEYKVPVQSLIDHIKTATDVDPWAKEMAEELLKEQEQIAPVKVNRYMETDENGNWFLSETYDCGNCGGELHSKANYCHLCGKQVKWE